MHGQQYNILTFHVSVQILNIQKSHRSAHAPNKLLFTVSSALWFFWPGQRWWSHPIGWHAGCSMNALLLLTSPWRHQQKKLCLPSYRSSCFPSVWSQSLQCRYSHSHTTGGGALRARAPPSTPQHSQSGTGINTTFTHLTQDAKTFSFPLKEA